GMELVLRDCPVDQESGVNLPPLAALTRGVGDCVLGKTWGEITQKWGLKDPKLLDGVLPLTPQVAGPYDVLLVWSEKDRVVKILARHDDDATKTAAKLKQAVASAWGKQSRSFGWPWRQDISPEGLLQSWGTQDDVTRVRIFYEATKSGATRLYTE